MLLSLTKGFNIESRYPLYGLQLTNNMWANSRKTRLFFTLLVFLGFLIFNSSSIAGSLKEDRIYRIAIIGDSLTQGYGLLPNDNLVAQLQDRLSRQKFSAELLNFGVSGDTTAGGLERFDWNVDTDVSGVVIILGGNDLLRGIPPSHSYKNLKKMIIKAQNRSLPVLLVGMEASTNFGSDFKDNFDKIFRRLKTEHNIFYYENFFHALSPDDVSLFVSYLQADGIHPNAEGVGKIVDDFYPTFRNFVNYIVSGH